HYVRGDSAERARADFRGIHRAPGVRDLYRGDAVVPWLRRPAADPGLGCRHCQQLPVPGGRVLVADALPGAGDRLSRDRRQPGRRLHRGGGHPVTLGASPQLAAGGNGLVLDASHVDVTYTVRGTDRLTVRDVSFQIGRQESFGLVGESGCGKTTMALAATRYLARNGRVSSGSITVNGQDIASLGKDALRRLQALA